VLAKLLDKTLGGLYTANVTLDPNGRVWLHSHGIRRCIVQVYLGMAVYRMPGVGDIPIGRAEVVGSTVVIKIPVTQSN